MAPTVATNQINTKEQAQQVAAQLSKPLNWQDEHLAKLEAIPEADRTVNNLRAMWRIYCHQGQRDKAEATSDAIAARGCTPRGHDQEGCYRGGF